MGRGHSVGPFAAEVSGGMRAIAAIAAVIVGSVAAFAADYPTRPITLIVPYPAGGGNDVIARLVAAKMSASLGEPIVIENRGGAGSTIGTRDAARRPPDGYTLLIATSSLAINPSLYPDAGYDPKKDFAAVGLIASSPNLVLVNPSVPAHSITDLIALAKREPRGLNFASTGTGTSTHLSAELFAAMAGVKLNPIPYKGVAPALIDLVAGQVPLMFCPTASVIGLVRQGGVRALATTGAKRSPLFPALPTVAEAGLPGYDAELHYGLVVPTGTPSAIVARLNATLNDDWPMQPSGSDSPSMARSLCPVLPKPTPRISRTRRQNGRVSSRKPESRRSDSAPLTR